MQDYTLLNIFHNLPVTESDLSKEIKMSLIYIAVIRKDPLVEDTLFCFYQFSKWILDSYIRLHHLYTWVCYFNLNGF